MASAMNYGPDIKVLVHKLRRQGKIPSQILVILNEDEPWKKLPTQRTIERWCQHLDSDTSASPHAVQDGAELVTILEGLRTKTIDAAMALKIRSVDEATRAISRLQKLISELDNERKGGISDEQLATVLATVLKVIASDEEIAPLLHGKEPLWLSRIKAAMTQVE